MFELLRTAERNPLVRVRTRSFDNHDAAEHRFSYVAHGLITLQEERYSLAIPVDEAIAFAMGWADLGYEKPDPVLRQIIGTLAVDTLQYAEEWRCAAALTSCLEQRWGKQAEQ